MSDPDPMARASLRLTDPVFRKCLEDHAAKDAEIARLRAALAVYANPDHWNTTRQPSLGPGLVWIWACVTAPLPVEFATKALEGK